MSGLEAHIATVRNALADTSSMVYQRKGAARPAFEAVVQAAMRWQAFTAAHPQEAALIEAGVSIADALRSKA